MTGLPLQVLAELGPRWQACRDARWADRPRRRAVGAGAQYRLVFIDRLLATLVHLRHGVTHDVLACWFGVSRSTITRAVGRCARCWPSAAAPWRTGSACTPWPMWSPRRTPSVHLPAHPRCNHVDSLMHLNPEHPRPMLPCFRTAFDALTAWVQDGREPPSSATVPRPAGNGATDLLNDCSL